MTLQSPNPASCLITAASILLEVDVRILVAEVGHDGMDALAGIGLRGYHIQEIMDCFVRRGYILFPVEPEPNSEGFAIQLPPDRIDTYLYAFDRNIIITDGHAIARKDGRFYDPKDGTVKRDCEYPIRELWNQIGFYKQNKISI